MMPSTLYETVTDRLLVAMKNRDQPRKDILRFLKGKMDLIYPLTDEAATKMIRSLLNDAKENPTGFTETDLSEMSNLVPPLLAVDQTLALLGEDLIEGVRAAKAHGQAVGIVMKALKGQPLDSGVVSSIVTKLRENP